MGINIINYMPNKGKEPKPRTSGIISLPTSLTRVPADTGLRLRSLFGICAPRAAEPSVRLHFLSQ